MLSDLQSLLFICQESSYEECEVLKQKIIRNIHKIYYLINMYECLGFYKKNAKFISEFLHIISKSKFKSKIENILIYLSEFITSSDNNLKNFSIKPSNQVDEWIAQIFLNLKNYNKILYYFDKIHDAAKFCKENIIIDFYKKLDLLILDMIFYKKESLTIIYQMLKYKLSANENSDSYYELQKTIKETLEVMIDHFYDLLEEMKHFNFNLQLELKKDVEDRIAEISVSIDDLDVMKPEQSYTALGNDCDTQQFIRMNQDQRTLLTYRENDSTHEFSKSK